MYRKRLTIVVLILKCRSCAHLKFLVATVPFAAHTFAMQNPDAQLSLENCCPIVELRQYTLHPGKRDVLIVWFARFNDAAAYERHTAALTQS